MASRNLNLIQKAFARKREAEFTKFEKNSEIYRYYDKWNKLTPKYEAWTAPEYYKNVEDNLKMKKNENLKKQQLNDRRQKLKYLLHRERMQYEEELKSLKTSNVKPASRNLLQRLEEKLSQVRDEKLRLELETRLNGKLRCGTNSSIGVCEKSKSDHQILAQLNRLDSQIDQQLQKEKIEKKMLENQLRLKELAIENEEQAKQRQKLRESEIKELRTIYETHIKSLKEHDIENKALQEEEIQLNKTIDELGKEIKNFLERKSNLNGDKYNNLARISVKRIKMTLRQFHQEFQDELKKDIELLNRIYSFNFCHNENVERIIQKLNNRYYLEMEKQPQIESMYESEAKCNLQKWSQSWLQEEKILTEEIKKLLNEQKKLLNEKLDENLQRQQNLINLREAVIKTIRICNDSLKTLTKDDGNMNQEQLLSFRSNVSNNSSGNDNRSTETMHRICSPTFLSSPLLTHSDTEINDKRPDSSHSNQSLPSHRFGIKKVAWT